MRISVHRAAAIFLRYDTTSENDKIAALERAQAHREAQPVMAPKVTAAFEQPGRVAMKNVHSSAAV